MATLRIDPARIEQNTRLVSQMLAPHGVRLVGVTKACLGDVRVGKAMLAGGAAALADSRAASIASLRRGLPAAELELMRPCFPPDGGKQAVSATAASICFVSTAAQAGALLAAGAGPLRVLLMIETGDGREGVPLSLAVDEARRLGALDGVELAGLATNAACARPQAPLGDAMKEFARAAGEIADAGCSCGPVRSAGGSGLLGLLPGAAADGAASPGSAAPLAPVSELRCGEAILLGRIPSGGAPGTFLPGAHRDAFILEAPVMEVFRKEGRLRALIGFGIQDAGLAPMVPLDAGVVPAKITSDYFVVNLTEEAAGRVAPGGRLSFIPPYYALLAAMTSPFVEKTFLKPSA